MNKKLIALSVLVMAIFLVGCSGLGDKDALQTKTELEPTPTATDTTEQTSKDDTNKATEALDQEVISDGSLTTQATAQESQDNTKENKNEVVTIKVTSKSLTSEGKWLTAISSTMASPPGSNLSPQLSWDEVEGAQCYAIYMVDNSAGYWLHWRAKNVTVNTLEMGAELEDSSYIGPYPPGGVHEYEVFVYALKEAPQKYPGAFDSNMVYISKIEEKLDIIDGVPGNIIGKGSIKGTVTVGETVE